MSTDESQTPPRRFGPGPLAWLGMLGFFALIGLVVVGFAIWSLARGPQQPEVLVEWGILQRGEPVHALADLSTEQDLSEGCLVTRGRAVSWADQEIVASVPLSGSGITLQGAQVSIHGDGQSVVCRFGEPGEAERFADAVARETLRTRPQS